MNAFQIAMTVCATLGSLFLIGFLVAVSDPKVRRKMLWYVIWNDVKRKSPKGTSDCEIDRMTDEIMTYGDRMENG